MSEVTRILSAIEQGDPQAAEHLLPLVYDELRKLAAQKLAQEKPGQTLQATALVHEAYLKLVKGEEAQHWNSRGHFFGAAAEAMRRILVNNARSKATIKRGADWDRVTLDSIAVAGGIDPSELLAFNDLFEQLIQRDPQAGEIARLRVFAGLSIPEIAEILDLGKRTVDRQWAFARAWLRTHLADE
jgi:RNA polymerase sigma factor (TIGR02999 family)